MKLYKPFFLTIIIVIMLICSLTGQTNIDINANLRIFEAEESSDPAIIRIFQDVDRYRNFDFNQDLRHLNARNVGQTMNLTFFEDKQYTADILKAEVNDAGRTVITAKILESDFGYAIITVSEDAITISAKVQENDEFFFASVKNGQAYLGQARLSEMSKDELPCGVTEEHHLIQNIDRHEEGKDNNNEVVIDLLYVYTTAAELWALNDWRVTDIHHLIDIVNATSNIVMANSETGIIFSIAHTHLTNYIEVDDWEDLDSFRDIYHPVMKENHILRNQYGADVMVFLAYISFTGGAARLLTDFDGFGFWDNYASSINRIQQVSWTYTVTHEIGHNMGADHHRDQNFQEGPNWMLGGYSSGWRGYVQDKMRVTVMSYEQGQYYADGKTAYRLPYFSSPLINLHGSTIGDAILSDNARLLRETKEVTASYRNRPNYIDDLAAVSINGYTNISVNNPAVYTVRIENRGIWDLAFAYSVHLMEVGNTVPLASIDGPDLLIGEIIDFEFIWTPTVVGQTMLWGHIEWFLDADLENNDTSVIFVTIHPDGVLLSENFDSNVGYHDLGWDFMINASTGIFQNSGVDGSKALAMRGWENSAWVYAITPEIGPVLSETILSFSYRIIDYTEDWAAPVTPYLLGDGDIVYIEVSSGGDLYIPIYQIDWYTHINSPDFAIIKLSLSEFTSEYITIRFNLERSTGSWFFVLDDVFVMEGIINLYNPPQNLTATAGNQIIDISWDEPVEGSSGNISGYRLFRGTSANSLIPYAILPTSPINYQETELTIGETYFYQIATVYNEPDGVSIRIPSIPVQATPFIWNAPRNLSLTLGTGQVVLNWQAPENGGAILSGYKIYRGTTFENMTQIHNITTNLSPNMSWVNDTDIVEGESYYYGIKASYSEPSIGDSDFSNIENSGPVSDDDETVLPTITALEGNFPNPFNPETTIRFSLVVDSIVSIDIYNIRGQRIKRLLEGSFERGFHSVIWNGTDENENPVTSGVYFYRMIAGEYAEVKRMVLMK
ncbi:MAG: M12 family metallo-peptidase [Candidatus Cloacimonetes bacterium]|nr:M12 family metallo-peptidase [Candidatus Cloacimonadota bacterium]